MTDDQTRAYEPAPAPASPGASAAPAASDPAAPAPAPVSPPPPAAPAAQAAAVAPAPRASRARWVIGLGVAGIVIALTIAGVMLLGGSSTPEALKYVPADAGFVAEVRMDLPGDQLQKVGNLLAHFPGFADQSTLPAKLDEALGRVVTQASNGQASFVTDIKPWLNGPLYVSGSIDSTATSDPAAARHFVAAATVNGGVDCTKALNGQTLTHETYKGLDIATSATAGMACVIDGRFALLGDPASVKAALDAKAAGTGLDKSSDYQAARRQLTGDQLATVFINGSRLKALAPSPGPSLGLPGMSGLGALGGEVPAWVMVGARAEDDAVVIDTVMAPVPAPSTAASLLPEPSAHTSVTASLAPAGTLAYLEVQGAGVGIQNLFSRLQTVPELQQPLHTLDAAGGPAGLAGWVDDVAIAVSAKDPTLADPHIKATVFLVAHDDATAAAKLATVKTFANLAGLSGNGGITVSTQTLSGVEVTTVTITDLGSLVPAGSVPGLSTTTLDTPVSFSLAAKGRVVYLSVGDGAMADALAVQAGASLADDAAFKLASQRGLANSRATAYVAVGATVDTVKGLLPPDLAAKWSADYAPYIEPLEALGLTVTTDATANRSRLVLSVSKP